MTTNFKDDDNLLVNRDGTDYTYTVWTEVRDDAAKDKWEETHNAVVALNAAAGV